MNVQDYANHAAPLSAEAPAGPNLEYDDKFVALGQYLLPQSASMVTAGGEEDDVSTDWRQAVSLGEELIETTRDLRVITRLGRCVLETKGILGLTSSIALIESLLTDMWEHVHPAPDADEDMDLMMRYNALGTLSDPTLLNALKAAPIAISATKVPVSLKTIEIAIGKRKAESEDVRNQASGIVGEVFAASDTSGVVAIKLAADKATAQLKNIVQIWRDEVSALDEARRAKDLRFDPLDAPQFEALSHTFMDISRHIAERLPKLQAEITETSEDGTTIASKGITTRADADFAIANVIEWFHRNEPSSPVPIMLERARSMISKSFLDIVEDLGEGGIAEARKVSGRGNSGGGNREDG